MTVRGVKLSDSEASRFPRCSPNVIRSGHRLLKDRDLTRSFLSRGRTHLHKRLAVECPVIHPA